jgi:ABC-2 type transport system ATP-binding protein
VLRLDQVSLRFGPTAALRDVSFAAAAGEIVGLVGPNGAGKTTALRVLAGVLAPDAGRATVDGHDVARDRAAALARLAYLPEAAPLYGEMRVEGYLGFRARLKRVPRAERAARIEEGLARFGLTDRARTPIARLSKGLRQRVGLADALLARPAALLLDEPTTGLDPGQVVALRELLAGLAGRHTILISSHALGELAALAPRWVVLAEGRVVGDGTPAELAAAAGLPPDARPEAIYLATTPRRPA